MTPFLIAFSFFNICLGFAAASVGMRLIGPDGRAGWASRRLHALALTLAWGLAVIADGATILAWIFNAHAAPIILAPIAWLVVMGAVFAIVDFAEDGVLDFGRGPKSP